MHAEGTDQEALFSSECTLTRSTFVGRASELERLGRAAEELLEGHGGVLAICGEAGTGKTRLVEEFRASLEPGPVQWIEGRARADGTNIPFHVFTDVLRRMWGIEDTDSPESMAAKVTQNAAKLLPDDPDAAAYLGRLFAIESSELAGVDPGAWRARLFELFHDADTGPAIMWVEDLQWADPSSIELLHHLAVGSDMPTLFICTYRPPFDLLDPEERSALDDRYEELVLTDLPTDEAEALVTSMLGTRALPSELGKLLRERAEGNPLQLEETVRALIGAGVLELMDDEWELTRPIKPSDVPVSLNGVLAARVEALSTGAKHVLQEAAIIGRTFPYEVLEQITSAPDDLDDSLARLEALDLVHADPGAPYRAYTFKHDLTQDAAYEELPATERPALHERLASVLEARYAERAMELSEDLALHYQRGLSVDKALCYLMLSGGNSVEKYALEEAHHYFEQAYELVSSMPEETEESRALLLDILGVWAWVFTLRGEHAVACGILEPHREMAESLDDLGRRATFYMGLAAAESGRGRWATILELSEKAYSIAEEIGIPQMAAVACNGLVWSMFELGELDEAVQVGWRGHELCRESLEAGVTDWQTRQIEWMILGGVCQTYWYKGEVRDARELAHYIEEESSARDDRRGAVIAGFCHAYAHVSTGELTAAVRSLDETLGLSPDPVWVGALQLCRCIALVEHGQEQDAEPVLEMLYELTKDRFLQVATLAHVHLASCRAARGEFREADSMIRDTMGFLEETNSISRLLVSQYLLGKVYTQLVVRAHGDGADVISKAAVPGINDVGDADAAAVRYLTEAIEGSNAIGAHGISCPANLELARLHGVMERDEQLRECATLSLKDAEERGAQGYVERAKEVLTTAAG